MGGFLVSVLFVTPTHAPFSRLKDVFSPHKVTHNIDLLTTPMCVPSRTLKNAQTLLATKGSVGGVQRQVNIEIQKQVCPPQIPLW